MSLNGTKVKVPHFQKTKVARGNRVQVYVEIPVSRKRPLFPEEDKTTATQKRLKMEVEEDTKDKIKTEDNCKVEEMMNDMNKNAIKTELKVEEIIILPPETISRYIQGLVDFAIHPTPPLTRVSRDLLNVHYKMSKILFLARIPAARNPSLSQPRCDRRVICATAEKNPAMPQGPGRPGLLFSCRQRMTQEWPWSLFLRRRAGEWEYEGEYECSHVGVLTPQEFASQDEKVKQSWAKKILESEKWPEYTTMRARIYLRKQNKEITQEEVQATIILLRSRGSKKKKTRQNGWENKLTAGDILDAFVRGDEQINIIAMTCVNYDHYFARDLSAKSASPRMSRKTSSHSGRSSARTTHPTRTLTHGRRIPAHLQDTFSDDEEKGSVHNSGEDSEEN